MMPCLIKIFTAYRIVVVLGVFLEKKERILSNTLKIRNKPVLLIMVGKSIRLKWVKVGTDDVCMSESFQD